MPATDDYFQLVPGQIQERRWIHKIALTVFACMILFSIGFIFSSYYATRYKKPSILTCQSPKYDYNLLALRWTPTFCARKKCLAPAEDWDIHGLWPSYKNGSQGPQNCCKTWLFNEEEIKPLIPKLNEEWPNQLPGQKPDSLWKHEWSKHGTCSQVVRSGFGSSTGMAAYFNMTLELFSTFPLEKWLNESDIKPTSIDDKNAIDIKHVHEAIEKHLKDNSTISIQCIKSTTTKSPLLDTIYLCFHPASMEIINCPSDRCKSSKVILPKSQ